MSYSRNKYIPIISIIIILLIDISFIVFYKYINLIIDTYNLFTINPLPNMNIALPLGISFFTFQMISYEVDVFRNTVIVQKNFFKFLLYISLFPQLIAGPIIRYKNISTQLDERTIDNSTIINGSYKFSIGLAKKVLIANVLGSVSTSLLNINESRISVLAVWFGIFLFSLQFYFDFSGYSDMALGLSKIFGFDFPENFLYPYISTSIREFWKRWHISLSSFFKEYVYIPLGGKYTKHVRNLFIVWFLTGLWHGASYNFILWGIYYFVFLVLEKRFIFPFLNKLPYTFRKLIGFIYTMFVVIIANTIFYFTDLKKLFTSLRIMFFMTNNPFDDIYVYSSFREYFFLILFSMLFATPIITNAINRFIKNKSVEMIFKVCVIIILMALSTFELVGQSYNPFLYFRF